MSNRSLTMSKISFFDSTSISAAKKRKRPSSREHELQATCVLWFRLKYSQFKNRLFAIPNGGRRDIVTAAKLKAEGVVAGVSDLILLKQANGYGALLIEMKQKNGRQSASQKEWQKDVTADKEYQYAVCHSFDEFKQVIEEYLSKR